MNEISIPIRLLRRLCETSCKTDIQQRAFIRAYHLCEEKNPAAGREFGFLIEDQKPAAKDSTELRYREIFAALESGSGIVEALERLVG